MLSRFVDAGSRPLRRNSSRRRLRTALRRYACSAPTRRGSKLSILLNVLSSVSWTRSSVSARPRAHFGRRPLAHRCKGARCRANSRSRACSSPARARSIRENVDSGSICARSEGSVWSSGIGGWNRPNSSSVALRADLRARSVQLIHRRRARPMPLAGKAATSSATGGTGWLFLVASRPPSVFLVVSSLLSTSPILQLAAAGTGGAVLAALRDNRGDRCIHQLTRSCLINLTLTRRCERATRSARLRQGFGEVSP